MTDCCDPSCQPDNAPGVTVCVGDGSAELGDALCDDCIDNDKNGYVDCKDFGCSKDMTVTVCGHEDTDALCSDGTDNDGNNFIDCKDFNCCKNSQVTVCANGCM